MLLIRTSSDSPWRTPPITAYTNEQALQAIIAHSPNLLPGATDTPMAVVREFVLPSFSRIDVVGVDPSGAITVVECKLKANSEIRREVVGQVLAYASMLWDMSYEEFDAAFAVIAGKPLADSVAALNPDGWDEEIFRVNVADNLAKGRFRLIIVVDKITDELKRIVQYLNEHTSADLQVLALELGYIKDGNIEILVPETYGAESAQQKENTLRQRWTEERVFAELATSCTPVGVSAARELCSFLRERGAQIVGNPTSLPWINAQFLIKGRRIPVVSIGEWPKDRGVVALNFEYLRGVITSDELASLANQVRTIPGVGNVFAGLEQAEFRKRPNLPIDQILTQTNAVTTIKQAIDALIQLQTHIEDEIT